MKEKCYDLIRSVGILLIIIWHFNTVCCENGFKLPFLLFWNKSGTIQTGKKCFCIDENIACYNNATFQSVFNGFQF